MPRVARIVVPEVPHHVVQRGNRRLQVFFRARDYETYITLLAENCSRWGVDIWAYCLMPNHVHIVAVPHTGESLSRAIGETHRSYAWKINKREEWRGHLWQERFESFPMDDAHLYLAARYVELNPVRSNIVELPWQYRWSSAAAHVAGRDDGLVHVQPLLEKFGNWKAFLEEGLSDMHLDKFRRHMQTGKPLGDDRFLNELEEKHGFSFRAGKRGPKGPWKKKDKPHH